MLSAGLDIMEWSEDPTLLVAGQTRPTVTKSKLIEVSVVDIGANDDALQVGLYHEGKLLTLAAGEESDHLPLLNLTVHEEKTEQLVPCKGRGGGCAASGGTHEVEGLLCGLHVVKERVEGVKADVFAQHDVFLFLVKKTNEKISSRPYGHDYRSCADLRNGRDPRCGRGWYLSRRTAMSPSSSVSTSSG